MTRAHTLPPFRLPVAYFGVAHVALLSALFVAALDPQPIAASFRLPHTIAVVHGITLGWLTPAILGATYVVAPLALKMPMPARRIDGWACASTLLGASGIVSHFWLGSYGGVGWSGVLVFAGVAVVAARVFQNLRLAQAPAFVRVHLGLGYANLLLAALVGTVLAFDRHSGALFPAASALARLGAHAHLALFGFATLVFIGVGYRLLPMFLPAAPPERRAVAPWISALSGEIGVLGLAAALLSDAPRPWVRLFAALIALGVVAFVADVVRALRNRRPPPTAMRRPDPGMLHALCGIGYLAVATALGLSIVFADAPAPDPGRIAAYGVCGVIGFLAQVVVGVEQRLLPVFAWTGAWAGSGFRERPVNPHAMLSRPLQLGTFAGWTAGVPILIHGASAHDAAWVSAGAGLLSVATALQILNGVRIVRRLVGRPRRRSS